MRGRDAKLFWYAGLIVIVVALIAFLSKLKLPPWLSALGFTAALIGIAGGLYRLYPDWRPVALFAAGMALTFAPMARVAKVIETSPTMGVLSLLVLELIAPTLILIGLVWCLYRAYRSR